MYTFINKKKPTIILECANAHDGNYKILKKNVETFSKLNYENIHIKFQPFAADKIAAPNYDWFKIYKKLQFTHFQWREIIKKSSLLYKGVWLDIFDDFSIEVLKKNIKNIFGIKIQSSTLENNEIIFKLKKMKYRKKIILNISGKKINEIENIVKKFEIISTNIILQSGFQDYPTNIKETNFRKVSTLQKKFSSNIFSYADHLDSSDIKSIFLPIKAIQYNCNIIEKHISYRGKYSKYDHFSSLNLQQIKEMFEVINFFFQNDNRLFVSQKEREYLNKVVQIPVANKSINKDSIINSDEISYLRTNSNIKKIHPIDFEKFYLAKKNIGRFEPFNSKNINQMKVGLFIACRLKSTRLKNKAILKLTKNHTLIEKCILSAKKIKIANTVAVTTSVIEEDKILKKYCDKHSIKFFQGSKDNVIKRYVDAAKQFKIDVIVRVTGDCPEISEEIVKILLKKYSKTNADYTVAKNCPIGFGAEIIKVSALQKILKIKPNANMSEYMTYYFTNNKKIFKLNFIKLPKIMQKEYRMTIDYKKDLVFFRELYKCFDKEKKEMSFKNLNYIMNKYKYLCKINSNLKLSYKTDKKLIHKINKASKIY